MLMLKRNLLTVSWNVFYKDYYIFLTHKRACIYENKVRLGQRAYGMQNNH